jgi:hypothetical protein
MWMKHGGRVERQELRARNEPLGKLPPVARQLLLPVPLPDHDAGPDLLRIGEEPFQPQTLARVEGRLVQAIDEEAGLLELDGEEEGRADVDHPHLAALKVRLPFRHSKAVAACQKKLQGDERFARRAAHYTVRGDAGWACPATARGGGEEGR